MIRKLLPIILCLVLCIGTAVGTSIVRTYWDAEEGMAFRADEAAIMAADLEQSARIESIGTMRSDDVVSMDDVKADTAHLTDAVSGKGADAFSKSLAKDLAVKDGSVKTDVVLMSSDGGKRVYLVHVHAADAGRMALVSVSGETWTVHDIYVAEEVKGDVEGE